MFKIFYNFLKNFPKKRNTTSTLKTLRRYRGSSYDGPTDTTARRSKRNCPYAVQLQPGQRGIVLGEMVQRRP